MCHIRTIYNLANFYFVYCTSHFLNFPFSIASHDATMLPVFLIVGIEGLQESDDRSNKPVVPGYPHLSDGNRRRSHDFTTLMMMLLLSDGLLQYLLCNMM
jgi:hypothetical protein